MFERREKYFWQRLNEKAGFYQDERTAQVQLLGVRRSYVWAMVLLPAVAAYQQWVSGQAGVFVVMLTAVALSWLFLLWRRHQLGGAQLADERFDYLHGRSYQLAYFFLLFVLGGYVAYLFFNSSGWLNPAPVPGLFWWTPAILATLIPLFATHMQKRTYFPRAWRLFWGMILFMVLVGSIIGFWVGSMQGP